MAGWQNIDVQEDARFRHLCPIVLRVMKAVYHAFDPLHEPTGIDTWWHSPSLSYQVEKGGSEPSIVILNLREGQPDNPAVDTHFMININTKRIHDKFTDEHFPAPTEILGDLEALKNCVCQVVISKKAAQERRARELRTQQEAKRKAFLQACTDYTKRLLADSLVDRDALGDDFENEQWVGDSCVLCGNQKFVSCNGCQIVSCQGSIEDTDCPGYEMDGLESCVVHPNTSYCQACRDKSGEKVILAQCPSCEEWHCRQDQAWCNGRPLSMAEHVQVAGSSLSKVSQSKNEKIPPKPSHPPQMEPCVSCLKDDPDLLPFMTCAGPTCWSAKHKVCEECAPEGRMQCSNNHKWYCDDCAAADSFSDVWHCPGCKDLFCPTCYGIERCFICGASSLCQRCTKAEKDLEGSANKSKAAQIKWKCRECGEKMCTECEAKGLAKTCDNCFEELCDECVYVDECVDCQAKMCSVCQHRECSKCGGWSESKRDDMMQDMGYGEYY